MAILLNKLFKTPKRQVQDIPPKSDKNDDKETMKEHTPQQEEDGKYFSVIPRDLGGSGSLASIREEDEEDASSAASTNCHDEDHDAAVMAWKSSGDDNFHNHSPLVAQCHLNPQASCNNGPIPLQLQHHKSSTEEINALNNAMQRSYKLPRTSHFSNNHIMVNRARAKRIVPALSRNPNLDTLARWHAEAMASSRKIFHSDPVEIQAKLKVPSRRIGENVAVGESIKDIHRKMMTKKGDYNNIIDRRFVEMGMGTAKGRNGELYLCQIFRG